MCAGANGCKWVCMGELGYGGTGRHKNKTSRGKNGLAWDVSVACMAGKFPGKTCMHVFTDKKGYKGLRRVRMGSDGCRGMYMHAANAKQGKRSDWWRAGHNCGQACEGEMSGNEGCGRHMSITEHSGVIWGARRVGRASHTHVQTSHTKSAHETTRKK